MHLKAPSKIRLGIDPSAIEGTTYGGIAVVGDNELIDIIKLNQPRVEIYDQLLTHIASCSDVFAVIENVWAWKGQSASGAFKFGAGYGSLLTMLDILAVDYIKVVPRTWNAYYEIKKREKESSTKWKGRLCDVARELFPTYKFNKQLCDAVLLAYYANQIK